jgi:RecA-family ATPase
MSNERRPDKPMKKLNTVASLYGEAEIYESEWSLMSEVVGRDQAWFWKNVIPLHTSTVLAGIGGIGKSLLLLNIISHVTNGETAKICGEIVNFPIGNVILLSAEDDIRSQLQPKLKAMNANLEKIHFIKSKIGNVSKKKRFLELDSDLYILEDKILKLKEINEKVTFIVIDPVTYFLGKVRDKDNIEVANFIQSLNDLAEKYNLAIILNKHLRKQASGGLKGLIDAINEISGASSWVTTPRMCWLITASHDDPNIKIMSNAKQNLIANDETEMSYAYRIVTHEGRGKLEWLDHKISINSKQAMNKSEYEGGKLEQGIAFILNYLKKNGQSRYDAIVDEAIKNGIKKKTIRNASEKFEQDYEDDIEITRGMKNAKVYRLI